MGAKNRENRVPWLFAPGVPHGNSTSQQMSPCKMPALPEQLKVVSGVSGSSVTSGVGSGVGTGALSAVHARGSRRRMGGGEGGGEKTTPLIEGQIPNVLIAKKPPRSCLKPNDLPVPDLAFEFPANIRTCLTRENEGY